MARKSKATRQQDYYGDFEPVQHVELSEKHLKLRGAVAVLFAAVGIFFLVRWLLGLFMISPGVQRIDVQSDSEAIAYAQEFALTYDLGASGVAAGAESRAISALYTRLLEEAKAKYDLTALSEGPGKDVSVSPELYKALVTLSDKGGRAERVIFAAPAYDMFTSVFFAQNDEEASRMDPYLNAELGAELARTAEYFSDPQHVRIELSGGKARLVLSEQYAAFAKTSGITSFASFAWLENALIVDYVADGLIAEGYRLGTLASFDGFSRNLGTEEGYAQSFIKSSPTIELDHMHYYVYADGSTRSIYLDPVSGLCADISDGPGAKVTGAGAGCFDIAADLAAGLKAK